MSDPSDNSSESDLHRAREIARRLAQPATPSSRTPEKRATIEAPTGFVAFSAARFRPQRAASVPAPARKTPTFPPPPTHSVDSPNWKGMLDWCVAALHAHSAFLIDAQGLLVAHAGALLPERAEAVGSRLQIAFEQGDRIRELEGSARSVSLEWETGWLWGHRVTTGADGWIALGILTPDAPTPEQQHVVLDAFGG